ncbi:hypothetical protein [Pseudomonas fulva]|uniref:hypothetical protein n=1 Tax=Pseudomonas fulva TaxID=47880 RepID=UPI00382125F2
MNIETSTVTKLLITEATNLDPNSVYLEDLAPCKGKITVSCYDKTWHAYWGGMWDGLTIGQFFCKLSPTYIIGYFDRSLSSRRFSAEALADKARQLIVQLRRDQDLDGDDARSLFDEADDVRYTGSLDECGGHREFMHRVFGVDWWNLPADAMEPNPDWAYLCSIIATVQQALAKQYPIAA